MAIKYATLDKAHARAVINNFFEVLQNLCNSDTPLKTADLERSISRQVEFSSNGQVVCHSSSEYLSQIEKYRRAYSSFEINNYMDEPLVADNKAIINYDVQLVERKTKKEIDVNVMAIVTIEDGKIVHWNQVANEKWISHWRS